MDLTLVDDRNIKNLEDLSIFLTTGLFSLITLQNAQVRAIELGIMPEDMNETANIIIWDLRRLIERYKLQIQAVSELLPEDFNPTNCIEKLKQQEIKKAKALIRKPRAKKDEKTTESLGMD